MSETAPTTVVITDEQVALSDGLRLCASEVIQWFHPDDAVDEQLYIVSGGVAYRKGRDWYSLTGRAWPGRKIEWEVTAWAPLLYSPIDAPTDAARSQTIQREGGPHPHHDSTEPA